jgi:hypothetical protein
MSIRSPGVSQSLKGNPADGIIATRTMLASFNFFPHANHFSFGGLES